MARIRTIHPTLARSPRLSRVSRDARLLFIQLWLVADDAGRLRLEPRALLDELYPCDTDAAPFLAAWLDELEREKCIECYGVEGKAYLRIRGWRKYQNIQHPTPSGLPGAPHEIREVREESRRSQKRRAFSDDVHESHEKSDVPLMLTEQTVLGRLDDVYWAAKRNDAFPAALRSTELLGRKLGLWHGRGKGADDAHEPPEERDVSPAEFHGLPITRSND